MLCFYSAYVTTLKLLLHFVQPQNSSEQFFIWIILFYFIFAFSQTFIRGTEEEQSEISLSHIKYPTSSASIPLLKLYTVHVMYLTILYILLLIYKKRKNLADHPKTRLFFLFFFIIDYECRVMRWFGPIAPSSMVSMEQP